MTLLSALLIAWTSGANATVKGVDALNGPDHWVVKGSGQQIATLDLSYDASRYLESGGLSLPYSGNEKDVTLRVRFTDGHGTVLGASVPLLPGEGWQTAMVDFSRGVQMMGMPPAPDWTPELVLYLDSETDVTVNVGDVQTW